jgi:hypothetical protein
MGQIVHKILAVELIAKLQFASYPCNCADQGKQGAITATHFSLLSQK